MQQEHNEGPTAACPSFSNFSQVLSRHNAKIARQEEAPAPPPGCNCQVAPATWPLDGQCKTDQLVHQATVKQTNTLKEETYTGGTTLCNHIWKLKM